MDDVDPPSVAAGILGGAVIGRVLGIGALGTVLGAFAGGFVGYLLGNIKRPQ